MKKIILFSIFLLQLAVCFGQGNEWSEWGGWTNCACYSKLSFRLKSASNPKLNTTSFMVEFKSAYGQPVKFGWVGSGSMEEVNVYFKNGAIGTQSDEGLNPGVTSTSGFSIKGAGLKSSYITVYRLTIGNDYQHYQRCDNATPCSYCVVNKDPYCPNYTQGSSQATMANNSNPVSSNDLDEYNRSKQQLETDMNRQNAEIARQNQDNTNKLKTYNNAIQAGVNAHNAGNYTEAKKQFTNAINNSNNEYNRKQAQDYLTKTNEGLNRTNNINTAKQALNTIGDIFKNIKTTKYDDGNNIMDNQLFNNFTMDVIIELEKAGLTYSSLNYTIEEKSKHSVEDGSNVILRSREYGGNIVSRNRSLKFLYNGTPVTVEITCRYFSLGNGTYFGVKVNTYDKLLEERLKNKGPFKQFQSASGSSQLDYKGKSMIKYTDRINYTEKNIFVYDAGSNVSDAGNKIAEEIRVAKPKVKNNNIAYEKLREADSLSLLKIDSGLDFKENFNDYLNIVTIYGEYEDKLSARQYFNYASIWRIIESKKVNGKPYPGLQETNFAPDFYKIASDRGYNPANNKLGDIYSNYGYGAAVNIDSAVKYYKRSALLNDDYANERLGQIYNPLNTDEKGEEKYKDVQKSIASFEKVIRVSKNKEVVAGAYYDVGYIYIHYKSKSFKNDFAKALRYMEKAVDLGEINACYSLGEIYEYGIGVPKNIAKAKKYYTDMCDYFSEKDISACVKLKTL